MCEDLFMQSVPMLKRKTLVEKINVALDTETYKELRQIKDVNGVDTMEWIRGLIRSELPKLKKSISA